jgi:hypothetical protein
MGGCQFLCRPARRRFRQTAARQRLPDDTKVDVKCMRPPLKVTFMIAVGAPAFRRFDGIEVHAQPRFAVR